MKMKIEGTAPERIDTLRGLVGQYLTMVIDHRQDDGVIRGRLVAIARRMITWPLSHDAVVHLGGNRIVTVAVTRIREVTVNATTDPAEGGRSEH